MKKIAGYLKNLECRFKHGYLRSHPRKMGPGGSFTYNRSNVSDVFFFFSNSGGEGGYLLRVCGHKSCVRVWNCYTKII